MKGIPVSAFGEERQGKSKTILVFSYILHHAFDWYLDFLDEKHMNAGIPENVRDVYNEEDYRNWISYHRESKRLGLAESVVCGVI